MKKSLLISFLLLLVPAARSLAADDNAPGDSQPWVTLFIHGTQPNWLIPYVINICYCPEGITHAASIPSENHYYKNLMSVLCDQNPQLFSLEHFYLGGWSGALCIETRRAAAQRYYHELHAISQQYHAQYGVAPKIRIISHSHGGNIALHLADYYSDDQPLIIDELILLGCPVQTETEDNITHAMFKKIYSIYSTSDATQTLDPQGMRIISPRIYAFFGNPSQDCAKKIFAEIDRPFFSLRTFKPHETLVQIEVTRNWIGIWHVEFMMSHFIKKLPYILHRAQHHDEPSLCITI